MPMNATKYIWFNGELVPWEKATVHVMSHALHYGSSVFEGIRCYSTPGGPAVFRLSAPGRRLLRASRRSPPRARTRRPGVFSPVAACAPPVRLGQDLSYAAALQPRADQRGLQ